VLAGNLLAEGFSTEQVENRLFDYTEWGKRSFDENAYQRMLAGLTPEQLAGLEDWKGMQALPSWHGEFMQLACSAGWSCDNDRVFREYKGDILRLFLDDRVIEQVDGRYRLSAEFIAQAPQH
jgi:hypothetical protein